MSAAGARCRELVRSNSFRVIASDVCTLIALILVLISVAVGSGHPTDSFNNLKVNFGLLTFVQCGPDAPASSAFAGCHSFDLGVIQNSNCKVGGQGVITAATFGMLFGLLSIFFLHVDVAGKQFFGKAIRFPRLFLFLFSFLSLTLYIVLVATWYNRCYNGISGITWNFVNPTASSESESTTTGYAVATSIAAIVFEFLAWCFSFWRTCSPNKNEPTRAPKADAATASGMMSPGGSSVPYAQQASTSNLGKVAGGDEEGGSNPYGTSGGYGGGGGAYSNGSGGGGGSAYGNNDESYSNDAASGGGYTSGGYGGSAGAYGGSSTYGGNKQESAYGY